MFERFTKPARRAVESAQIYAQAASANEVRPEHLLQAVLADETYLAARVLAEVGAPGPQVVAELERLRARYVDGLDEDDAEALQAIGIDLDEVVRRIERNLGGTVPARRRPRFARGSKKALELALREAIALRHNYIGTEHILLGLVRSDDRAVTQALATFGVDIGALRTSVAEAVRKAS
jgi:ATP-dependent Clp protease ATP-binding subunit ClpA